MQHFFVNSEQIDPAQGIISIDGPDAGHIGFSLRMACGEKILVTDRNTSTRYECTLTQIQPQLVLCHIEEIQDSVAEPPYQVTLFQALPKADKMEWIIQKSVECGVSAIVPFASSRCIVKLDREKGKQKTERWNKISLEAAKQCKRGIVPPVLDVHSFDQARMRLQENSFDLILICYENEGTCTFKQALDAWKKKDLRLALVIGPEGGFSLQEVEMMQTQNAKSVSLGNRILRTETAPIVALSYLSFLYELT
ncbi:MAG: 16S rRNA (uracil(1498)-N(3))-methyltransferase [Clostridia bacterium]|nr:16S rRNA (uracil(1498)-N(3))-methyltransferase [Clostridia bacterium]